ncbi:hypothetical protein LBK6_03665 [Leptospira borgpetersenii serovar Hardjo]|nr:hypothetical protein LBK6_03665 [Leptospira borgpetersenii serovar Hardjo]AMX60726.1 hypothetical protein LBK9_03610 [Leptospira borgpetersenii serovar Hardjo]AMX63971.1 hypothetical protein LBK30_03655 [Leptospira borgpetersenii serovar Hardjo]AMX67211.1 hypothetical protein LBHA_03625 [Leptospira borgpetersenii serovar Hardjo]AMX72106.1 hypothetical protein LBHB_12905 [Leptospira borgpetersenii serovar Hardjo]
MKGSYKNSKQKGKKNFQNGSDLKAFFSIFSFRMKFGIKPIRRISFPKRFVNAHTDRYRPLSLQATVSLNKRTQKFV